MALKTQNNLNKGKTPSNFISALLPFHIPLSNKPYAISIIIDFGWGIIVQPGIHAGHFVPHELLIISGRT
jgi:hypothetical protein